MDLKQIFGAGSDAPGDSKGGFVTTGVGSVRLAGAPEGVGCAWGAINARAIAQDMESQYLAPAREAGISRRELARRGRRWIEIAEELAPHWLAEGEGVAAAAGVDAELYLSFVGGVYRRLFLHECTSYTVQHRYTEGGAILFHKNRDNADRAQAAFVMGRTAPGVQRYLAVSDASVIACMMMVNEKGLAGSADTGGLPERAPRYQGLMNTHVLRLIAERDATCGQALRTIQECVRAGLYAGGAQTGTHWLFVDRGGTVLEVSSNAGQVRHRYHTQKIYFSAREDSAAARALRDARAPVGWRAFHCVSRDPSICFDSSISGMTVEIDPLHPGALTCAWIALPARSASIPLFLGQGSTPRPLLDGSIYALGKAMPAGADVAAWDQAIHDRKEAAAGRALALIEQGEGARAEALLDEWAAREADRAMRRLSGMGM